MAVALLTLVVAALGCGAPAPSVAGPGERFVARLRDPAFDLVAGLKGSYSLSSDEVFPVWGALAIDGPDARLVTAMEGPLGIEAREQIVRQDDGHGAARCRVLVGSGRPGRRDRCPSHRLAGIETVDVVGSEVVDGRPLQHLRASGLPIGPAAFGIEGSEPSPATLDAWVDDDGSPARLRVKTGPLTVDLDTMTLGQAAPIHAPPALASLVSSALRYSFVLPASWDVRERGTSGHLIGLDGAYVITYCAAGSMKLPNWVNDGTTVYNELWGAEPESVEPDRGPRGERFDAGHACRPGTARPRGARPTSSTWPSSPTASPATCSGSARRATRRPTGPGSSSSWRGSGWAAERHAAPGHDHLRLQTKSSAGSGSRRRRARRSRRARSPRDSDETSASSSYPSL